MEISLNSKGFQVKINTMGAELKSFTSQTGKEYLWNSNPKVWARSSPLLFPTIGNVRNNQTIINGKIYSMPKHGFARDQEFQILEQSSHKVIFRLKDNPKTLLCYPYHFQLDVIYELNKNVLSLTYKVTNESSSLMPYHIGAHPGFTCPLEEHEDFSDYIIEFEKEETFHSHPYDLKELCFLSNPTHCHGKPGKILALSRELFQQDAVFFPHINSRKVSLLHPITKKGVCVEYPDFTSIAFWTPSTGTGNFICLEPWNGSAIYEDEDDEFIHKRDMLFNQPGEEKEYHLAFTIF